MRKKLLILSLFSILFVILTGCQGDGDKDKETKEHYIVKGVHFYFNKNTDFGDRIEAYKAAKVETEDNYLLINNGNTTYKKSNAIHTKITVIKKGDDNRYVLHIANADLKKFSKDYIDKFDENLPLKE